MKTRFINQGYTNYCIKIENIKMAEVLLYLLKTHIHVQFGLKLTTNKPTRITKDMISAIDHVIIIFITNNEFKTSLLTADISDHLNLNGRYI